MPSTDGTLNNAQAVTVDYTEASLQGWGPSSIAPCTPCTPVTLHVFGLQSKVTVTGVPPLAGAVYSMDVVHDSPASLAYTANSSTRFTFDDDLLGTTLPEFFLEGGNVGAVTRTLCLPDGDYRVKFNEDPHLYRTLGSGEGDDYFVSYFDTYTPNVCRSYEVCPQTYRRRFDCDRHDFSNRFHALSSSPSTAWKHY